MSCDWWLAPYSSLIGQNLVTEELVTVAKIEFLESHLPYHSAVFHYIVLVYLQVPATAVVLKIRRSKLLAKKCAYKNNRGETCISALDNIHDLPFLFNIALTL